VPESVLPDAVPSILPLSWVYVPVTLLPLWVRIMSPQLVLHVPDHEYLPKSSAAIALAGMGASHRIMAERKTIPFLII
jgi:hypothetical protein